MVSRAHCDRLYEQKRRGERLSREERPAPKSKAAPQTVENINSGTHLLGLLSNTHITHSHESMEYSDTKIEDTTGRIDVPRPEPPLSMMPTTSVFYKLYVMQQ